MSDELKYTHKALKIDKTKRMESVKKKTHIVRVLKTNNGYLANVKEEDIEDGRNYDFTKNPLDAYNFESWLSNFTLPKYLDSYSDEELKTEEDACKFLNGEMVNIRVEETVRWTELYKENSQ